MYFRLGGFQVKEEPSVGGGEKPDQTRLDKALLPPHPSHPGTTSPNPFLYKDFTGTEYWSSVGREEKPTGEEGASLLPAQSVWGNCFLCCVLDKTLTFAGHGEVPRPQALVAFCIHFSGFQTGSNLGAEVRKQSIRLILTAQLWPTERQRSWFLLPHGRCGLGLT